MGLLCYVRNRVLNLVFSSGPSVTSTAIALFIFLYSPLFLHLFYYDELKSVAVKVFRNLIVRYISIWKVKKLEVFRVADRMILFNNN